MNRHNRNIIDGKEINVTLTDALISLESLRFMMGGAINKAETDKPVYVRHNEEVVCVAGGKVPKPKHHLYGKEMTPTVLDATHPIRLINLTTGTRTQLNTVGDAIDGSKAITFHNPDMIGTTDVATKQGDRVRIFWYEKVEAKQADQAIEVTISPDTFPGTYRIVGDTFMRNSNGKDEAFQFIINKAKVASNVTLTLEAEGDPSTFEMTVNALRSTNERGENEMMKLVRYTFDEEASSTEGNDFGSLTEPANGSLNPNP